MADRTEFQLRLYRPSYAKVKRVSSSEVVRIMRLAGKDIFAARKAYFKALRKEHEDLTADDMLFENMMRLHLSMWNGSGKTDKVAKRGYDRYKRAMRENDRKWESAADRVADMVFKRHGVSVVEMLYLVERKVG